MKKKIILLIIRMVLFIINVPLFAQTNFVPNPSFEDKSCCPSGNNPNGGYSEPLSIPCLNDWRMPERKNSLCRVGTPDYMNTCGAVNAGSARSGSGYARFVVTDDIPEYREYITVQLTTTLVSGRLYYVEFYARELDVSSGQVGSVGAYFSNDRPKVCKKSFIDDQPNPHIENTSLMSYNNSWVRISGTFIATGFYNWITIGNFKDDANTIKNYAHLLIDDVKVFDACLEELLIENTIYTQHENPYEAEVIRAGYDVGAPTANGDVIVMSGADITYKAEREIAIDTTTFFVEPGALFSAFLAPCGRNCFFPVANAGGDLLVCGSQPGQQLGMSPEEDCFYLWSASPASAIAYLNNPAISNPVFNIPSAGWGTVVYTLTVTNKCGDLVTDEVMVNYEAQPDPNPFVIVSNVNPGAYISFDLAVNPHTEQVKIEVYNWAMTSVLHSYTLNVGVDFNCCFFSWAIPDYLTNCYDYKVKVFSKNFCHAPFSTPVIVDWVKDRNINVSPIPNAFTPNGDGVNEEFCILVTGAESYTVNIYSPAGSGSLVYFGSGTIAGNVTCVWDGHCNAGVFCSGQLVNDGIYYYTIDFSNCINEASAFGFVHLYGESNKTSWSDSIDNGSDNTNINTSAVDSVLPGISNEKDTGNENALISIFPNPNEGSFALSVGAASDFFPTNVFVYDVLGNIVYQATDVKSPILNIDISGHAKGIYLVRVQKGNEQFLKKVVKQ